MKNCKHFEICGLNANADSEDDMCILHSTNLNKSKQDFNIALNELRSKNKNDFEYIVFPDKINFEMEIFTENVFFRYCTFCGNANFNYASFDKAAIFDGATFNGYATFNATIFSKYASFSGTTFKNYTSFLGTKFKDKVSFLNSDFSTIGPSFSGVKFVEGAEFIQINFQSANARFIDCYFSGKTEFRSGRIGNKFLPLFSEARLIEFIGCEIDPSNPLIFRNVDMSVVAFYDTRLLNIEFTDIHWPKIKNFFGMTRLAIYDELENLKRLKSEKDKDKQKRIRMSFIGEERLYRDLKNNYQIDKDWDRAGDFHYGEKEMCRKNPNTNIVHRLFLTFYWILSGYGERYLRPLFWTIIILLVSTFGYRAHFKKVGLLIGQES